MQKGDDGLVQKFCNDVGVSRGVFKVWMHNNKNKRSESDVGIGIGIGDQNVDDKNNDGGGSGFRSDINNEIHTSEDGCVNNVHVSSVNGN